MYNENLSHDIQFSVAVFKIFIDRYIFSLLYAFTPYRGNDTIEIDSVTKGSGRIRPYHPSDNLLCYGRYAGCPTHIFLFPLPPYR